MMIIDEKMKPYLGRALNYDFNTFMRKERILRDFLVLFNYFFIFAIPFNLALGWKGLAGDYWDLQNPIVIIAIILAPVILIFTSFCQALSGKRRDLVLYVLLTLSLGLFATLSGYLFAIGLDARFFVTFVSLAFSLGTIIILLILAWVANFAILWVTYDKISEKFCWALGSAESTIRALGGYKKAIKLNPTKIFEIFIVLVTIYYYHEIPKNFEQNVIKGRKNLQKILSLDDEELTIKLQKRIITKKENYNFNSLRQLIDELMEVAINTKNYKKAYSNATPEIKSLIATDKAEGLVDTLEKAPEIKEEQQLKPVPKKISIPTQSIPAGDPFKAVFAMELPEQKLNLPSIRNRLKAFLALSESMINESLEELLQEKRISSESQLLQILRTETGYKIRMAAVHKLEAIATKEAIQALIEVVAEEANISMPCIGDNEEDFDNHLNNKLEEDENEGKCQLSAKAVKVLGNIGRMLGSYGIPGFDSNKYPDAIKKMKKETRLTQKDLIEKSLLAVLEKSRHAHIKWHIAEALGKLCGEESKSVLISTMENDEMETVRVYSAEALGRCLASSALLPLIECLDEEEEEMVQEAIIEAIAKIGSSIIKLSKKDKSQEGTLKTLYEEAIPRLKMIAKEENDEQKKAWVLWCLESIGIEEIVPFIESIKEESDDKYVRKINVSREYMSELLEIAKIVDEIGPCKEEIIAEKMNLDYDEEFQGRILDALKLFVIYQKDEGMLEVTKSYDDIKKTKDIEDKINFLLEKVIEDYLYLYGQQTLITFNWNEKEFNDFQDKIFKIILSAIEEIVKTDVRKGFEKFLDIRSEYFEVVRAFYMKQEDCLQEFVKNAQAIDIIKTMIELLKEEKKRYGDELLAELFYCYGENYMHLFIPDLMGIIEGEYNESIKKDITFYLKEVGYQKIHQILSERLKIEKNEKIKQLISECLVKLEKRFN
ncbi:MAG: hypothetical protein FK730_04435 [Asgard group archaeon]|nr:hypothetical protein [Asgard group archaeon]